MSPALERIELVAEAGYLFVYPLVRNYTAMYLQAVASISPVHVGGFGRWARHRMLESFERDARTTHALSLHSWLWLDVRSEPVVVSVVDSRAGCVTRITDLWGFVVAEHESDGDAPTWSVVVAPPDGSGIMTDVDEAVVRGESAFLRCETWSPPVEMIDADTTPPYRVEAARIGGHRDPEDPGAPIEWLPASADVEAELMFWGVASFALGLVWPHADDAARLETLGEIGVEIGRPWEVGSFEPDELGAIGQGMDAAISELSRRSAQALVWPRSPSRPLTDRDLVHRAVAALSVGPGLPAQVSGSSPT